MRFSSWLIVAIIAFCFSVSVEANIRERVEEVHLKKIQSIEDRFENAIKPLQQKTMERLHQKTKERRSEEDNEGSVDVEPVDDSTRRGASTDLAIPLLLAIRKKNAMTRLITVAEVDGRRSEVDHCR